MRFNFGVLCMQHVLYRDIASQVKAVGDKGEFHINDVLYEMSFVCALI